MRLFTRTEPLTAEEIRLMAEVCDEFEKTYGPDRIATDPIRFTSSGPNIGATVYHVDRPLVTGWGSTRESALITLRDSLACEDVKPAAKGTKS